MCHQYLKGFILWFQRKAICYNWRTDVSTKSRNNEKSTLHIDQRSLLCWIAPNEIAFLFRFSKSRPGLFSAYLTGITPPMTEADLAAQRLADAALQQQLRMSGFASAPSPSNLGMVPFTQVLFYVIFIWHHWSIHIKGFWLVIIFNIEFRLCAALLQRNLERNNAFAIFLYCYKSSIGR